MKYGILKRTRSRFHLHPPLWSEDLGILTLGDRKMSHHPRRPNHDSARGYDGAIGHCQIILRDALEGLDRYRRVETQILGNRCFEERKVVLEVIIGDPDRSGIDFCDDARQIGWVLEKFVKHPRDGISRRIASCWSVGSHLGRPTSKHIIQAAIRHQVLVHLSPAFQNAPNDQVSVYRGFLLSLLFLPDPMQTLPHKPSRNILDFSEICIQRTTIWQYSLE